ncbi:hypothetical protein Clacol_002603 [Clathrus columnatus]|uniref:Zn(2)-C6 fungal-type domain-containing protein n=1 Tax=Clathrus columnatus TaxID=1419009 RepID=A0AAV5A4J4_9AGAM|nr:hypothetical protein Clacol_002603 [Clathrus columnatus]
MSSLPIPPPPPPHTDPALDPGASSVGGKKKRGGAPKAKGAVRAKSGCYTCRIRRKKCDEQPDKDGNCQTCVRLRLECLGFGAKRPEWMRENNSVQELREKIKQFLASQGMIKGHSGSGVRSTGPDPSVLNLSTEHSQSQLMMPPQTMAHHPHAQPDMRGQRIPTMSTVRDGTGGPPPPPPPDAMHGHHMIHHFPAPLPGGHPFPPPPHGQNVHLIYHPMPPGTAPPSNSRSPPTGPHPHPPPGLAPGAGPPPPHAMMPVHLDPELYMPPGYPHPPPHPHAHPGSHPHPHHQQPHHQQPPPGPSGPPPNQHPQPHHPHPQPPTTAPAHVHAVHQPSSQPPLSHQQQQQQQQPPSTQPPPPTTQSGPAPPPSSSGPASQQQSQQQQQANNTHSMSSIPASPWPSAPSLQPCSFGASYNITNEYFENQVQEENKYHLHHQEEDHQEQYQHHVSSSTNADGTIVSTNHDSTELIIYSYPHTEQSREETYIRHYIENVLKIQYLLADSSVIGRFIYHFGQTSPSARSAMCLLAAVHLQRMRQLGGIGGSIAQQLQQQQQARLVSADDDVEEPDDHVSIANEDLVERLLYITREHLEQNVRDMTEGDAMAGLHVVSGYLFMGGQGPWEYFLGFARYWVGKVLRDKQYRSPLEAYRNCSVSAKFIIRTTMWFDVWSAVTGKTEPKFKDIYRELFDGEHGYHGQEGEVDMLSVMGCTNETVLAMSETAVLGYWKDMEMKRGTLSVPKLVERGRAIEKRYLSREHDATLLDGRGDNLDLRRRLAANVFRSSARVYLHSILSGCMPQVEEIHNGVDETVRFLKMIPTSAGASGSVIRSVVLSIALCGCMTDEAEHREFLSSCLISLAGQEVSVLGNCRQAKLLMERVWELRDGGKQDVDWRDVMSPSTLLLKCDEQRENNSCQTCRRLKIDCLGWGVRRPEWMRDKTQVDAYKARIKNQLSSQGMIRGQRKLPSASPRQYPYSEPSYTNGHTHSNNDSPPSDEAEDYNNYPPSTTTSPAYHTVQMPQATPDLHLFPTPGAPLAPLPHAFATSSPHVIPSELSMIHFQQAYYDSMQPMSSQPVSPTAPQTPSHKTDTLSPQNRDPYILYFFRQIRQIHFLFSGPNIESVLRDLVVREPTGVVATSICALAALHQSLIRATEGLEDPSSEHSQNAISKQFHDRTWWLLQQSRQRLGRYTEQDATAAIHLVTYSLLSGGTTDWEVPLNVTSEWLSETPLNTFQNPRLQWLQQSPSARFTAQMTMWFDIVAAINIGRTPRFIDLYRRIFRTENNSTFRQHNSQQSSSTPPTDFPIQLSLTGCPDGVMYALAETACLSQWKDTQIRSGCLSYRELVRRAEEIENGLKTRCGWAIGRTTGSEVTLGVGMGLGMYFPEQLGQQSHHSSLYSHSQQQTSSQTSLSQQQSLHQQSRHRIQQQNHYQSHPSTPSSQTRQFEMSMRPSLSVLGSGLAPLTMGFGMGHNNSNINNYGVGSSSATTYPTPSPTLHSSMDLSSGMSVTTPISPTSTSEQTILVSSVFYEAAIMYLWSTVSGHFVAIPEIADSTQSLVNSLHKLERPSLDMLPDQCGRGLLFPICLAGCLSDTREHRDFFRNCLAEILGLNYVQGLQLGGIGGPSDVIKMENNNSPQQQGLQLDRNGNDNGIKGRSKIIDLMEEVWRRRDEIPHSEDAGIVEVDWRKVRGEVCGQLLVI